MDGPNRFDRAIGTKHRANSDKQPTAASIDDETHKLIIPRAFRILFIGLLLVI